MGSYTLVSNLSSTDSMLSDTLFLVTELQSSSAGQTYVSRKYGYGQLSGQLSGDLRLPAVWDSQRRLSTALSGAISSTNLSVDGAFARISAVSSDLSSLSAKNEAASQLVGMSSYIAPLSDYTVWDISSGISAVSAYGVATRIMANGLSDALSALSDHVVLCTDQNVGSLSLALSSLSSKYEQSDGSLRRLWLSAALKAPGETNLMESDNEFATKTAFDAGIEVRGGISADSVTRIESDGEAKSVFRTVTPSNRTAFLAAQVDASGNGFLSASSVKAQHRNVNADLAVNSYVATTDWATDTGGTNNILHTDGAETVYGPKTFEGRTTFNGDVTASYISVGTLSNQVFQQVVNDVKDLSTHGTDTSVDVEDLKISCAGNRRDIDGLSSGFGRYVQLSAPTTLFLDGDRLKMMSANRVSAYSQVDLTKYDNVLESVYISVQNPDPTGQQAHLPQGRYLNIDDAAGNHVDCLISDLYVGDCQNHGGVYDSRYSPAAYDKYVTVENYKVKMTDWAIREFTRDKLLSSVELSTVDNQSYLIFHFKVESGHGGETPGDVTLPLTSLVNIYCDDEGINIDNSTRKVSVKLATDSAKGGVKTYSGLSDKSNRNYGLKTSSERGYVNVPWTEQKGFVTNSASGTSNTAAATANPYFNIVSYLEGSSHGVMTSHRFSGSGNMYVTGQNGSLTFSCGNASPASSATAADGAAGFMSATDKYRLDHAAMATLVVPSSGGVGGADGLMPAWAMERLNILWDWIAGGSATLIKTETP